MSGRKVKEARRQVYGDRNPLSRRYRVACDKHGLIVGKFVTVEGKRRLVAPTIVADYQRQMYQRLKKGEGDDNPGR